MRSGQRVARLPCAGPIRSTFPTGLVAAITLLTSVVAQLEPVVMAALVRNRPQFLAGQWWRAFTPMLVQPDGWGQLAFNMLGIALVGAAARRQVGATTWLTAYVIGGVGGVALYLLWHPTDTGGGSSAAVAALIGLLASTARTGSPRFRWVEFAHWYSIFFAVYLTVFDLGGVVAAVVAGNVAIVVTAIARRACGAARIVEVSGLLVLVAGVVMTTMRDDHGAGLLVGLAVGTLTPLVRQRSRRRGPPT